MRALGAKVSTNHYKWPLYMRALELRWVQITTNGVCTWRPLVLLRWVQITTNGLCTWRPVVLRWVQITTSLLYVERSMRFSKACGSTTVSQQNTCIRIVYRFRLTFHCIRDDQPSKGLLIVIYANKVHIQYLRGTELIVLIVAHSLQKP